MRSKLFFVLGILVTLGTALLFFPGCAQPPTEKVTSVQNNLKECADKGALLFAKDDYSAVVLKMHDLTTMMDQKKYRKADALADSILTDIATLKTVVESNGRKTAQQLAVEVDDELGKLKALVASDESKLFDKESKIGYETTIGTFENQTEELQKRLGDGDFAGVYRAAGSIKGRIIATGQEASQKIEQAKALAAEKAAAKKVIRKKPAPSPKKN